MSVKTIENKSEEKKEEEMKHLRVISEQTDKRTGYLL